MEPKEFDKKSEAALVAWLGPRWDRESGLGVRLAKGWSWGGMVDFLWDSLGRWDGRREAIERWKAGWAVRAAAMDRRGVGRAEEIYSAVTKIRAKNRWGYNKSLSAELNGILSGMPAPEARCANAAASLSRRPRRASLPSAMPWTWLAPGGSRPDSNPPGACPTCSTSPNPRTLGRR